MLRLLFTAVLIATCSAARKPTNTTLLHSQFHDSEVALNQSATEWFDELHDQATSQSPGVATALGKLSVEEFRAAVLALAQRNITINSPECANDSHLPIRKCLGRSNATASRDIRSIVSTQKRACKAGISSLVNWSFESAVSKCFNTSSSTCAAQAPACIRALTQDLDTQLSNLLASPRLSKRNDVAMNDSTPTNGNSTALQKHRKLAVDLTTVTAIGDAFAFLFFMSNPITETFVPFVFLTVALGLAAADVHRTR